MNLHQIELKPVQDCAQNVSMPQLIRVWPDWGQPSGMTRGQAYVAAEKLPAGVKVKLGGRIWLNSELLRQYLLSGGELASFHSPERA